MSLTISPLRGLSLPQNTPSEPLSPVQRDTVDPDRARAWERFSAPPNRVANNWLPDLSRGAQSAILSVFPEITQQYRATHAHSWAGFEKLAGVVGAYRQDSSALWTRYREPLSGVADWITNSATGTPPRFGTHPLDRMTREPDTSGRSPEERLRNAIVANSGNGKKLDPGDVLQLSLQANGNDYFKSLLTAHNLLKNLAQSERNPEAVSAAQQRADQDLRGRLVNLRPPQDQNTDKMGPWYHIYAVGMLDVLGTPVISQLGARVENLDFSFGNDAYESSLNVLAASAFSGCTISRGLLNLFGR